MKFGADFDALIARFSPDTSRPLGLAVSGGSDSLALLSLADEWAGRTRRALVVFTVDHQLRPEAGTEAAHVATLANRLGHHAQTLVWTAPRASQRAARTARYRLICAALSKLGGTSLLVGHTRDDVVETALIRRRRGVRGASIAGPTLAAPAPTWPTGRGINVLRPLVQTSRAALRQHLQQCGWRWSEDPSNESRSYERVRVRQFLMRHPALCELSTQFVCNLQHTRAREDHALGENLGRVRVTQDGLIDTHEAELSPRLLGLLARCASGSDLDPRAHALGALIEDLDSQGARQTLGGAWFQKTATGFLIGRDPGASALRREADLFDGRFARSGEADVPRPEDQAFLVRHASPPDQNWREIISERLAQMALCYQTDLLNPIKA